MSALLQNSLMLKQLAQLIVPSMEALLQCKKKQNFILSTQQNIEI